MNPRKNFELVTHRSPSKKNAIEVCGKEFIDTLTAKKIRVKDDQFWIEVNRYLNIPDDAYEQMLIQQEEEQKRQEEEQETEKQRLIDNKTLLEQKTRDNWTIDIYKLPESNIFCQKYMAEANKAGIQTLTTDFSETAKQARDRAFSLVDTFESELEKYRYFLEEYKVLKPIYLMFLYLSGWDEHNPCMSHSKEKRCKENFTGVTSWVNLQWEILGELEKEGLLEQPQRWGKHPKRVTYVELTKKGIRTVRDILQKINLEGAEFLLHDRDYHEDYLEYKTHIDIRREEEDRQAQEEDEINF